MTPKQKVMAIRRARRHLKAATGFDPEGGHYKAVLDTLYLLEADALKQQAPAKPPMPNLGPLWRGGKSVLDHDLTHPTGGIPLYPALDDAFVAGREILAPEAMTVTRASSSRPGSAFYATGRSGLKYWFGHLSSSPRVGTRFRKGQVVGRVLYHTVGGGPHVHLGINAEAFLGKGRELVHRTNYTHGAPTVREQLKKVTQ